MNGQEYTFEIPTQFKTQFTKLKFIDFFEKKIKSDQLGIRTFPTLNYEVLATNISKSIFYLLFTTVST